MIGRQTMKTIGRREFKFIAEVKNGDTVYDFTANDVAVASWN